MINAGSARRTSARRKIATLVATGALPPAAPLAALAAPDSASGPAARNFAALASADTQSDWILPAGNCSGNCYVNQDQITAANVGQMRTAWTFRIPDESPIKASPVMWHGMVYVTSEHDDAYAVNAKTGKLEWQYTDHPTQIVGFSHNRGVAVMDGKVFIATIAGHPVALEGALATTDLAVPEGGTIVAGCEAPTGAPAYGIAHGYLLYVAVPIANGAIRLPEVRLPEVPGVRDITLGRGLVIVHTAATGMPKDLCAGHKQAAADPSAAGSDTRESASLAPRRSTEAQAIAGEAVFIRACTSCHGRALEGNSAPANAGTRFLDKAGKPGWSVSDMHTLAVSAMPLDNPGSLTPAQYADVLAYLRASDCYPAGSVPFPVRDSARLKATPLAIVTAVRPDNPQLGTCRVGQSRRGTIDDARADRLRTSATRHRRHRTDPQRPGGRRRAGRMDTFLPVRYPPPRAWTGPGPGSSVHDVYCVSALCTRKIKQQEEPTMAWKRPVIREICIGMEINAYLPSEL